MARFDGLDHKKLLRDMLVQCFMWLRYGNKREERMACYFLNEIQTCAHHQNSVDEKQNCATTPE